MIVIIFTALTLFISAIAIALGKRAHVAYYSSIIAGGIIGIHAAVESGGLRVPLGILISCAVYAFILILLRVPKKVPMSLARIAMLMVALCVNLIVTPNVSRYGTTEEALAVSLPNYLTVVFCILTIYLTPKLVRGVSVIWGNSPRPKHSRP